MKVVTDIERLDLVKFNLSAVPRMSSTYKSIIFIALLVFAFLSWKKGFPSTSIEWLVSITASLIGGVTATIVSVVFSMLSILLMSTSNNGTLGVHEYSISAEGLYEKTEANEGLSKWEGVYSESPPVS